MCDNYQLWKIIVGRDRERVTQASLLCYSNEVDMDRYINLNKDKLSPAAGLYLSVRLFVRKIVALT